MKHSVPGDSMTEVLEPKVVIPCPDNCESVLQKLYIDLCNLIVEARIPRFNEKGYGDGVHCPPLLGPNTHGCDISTPECQKHQRLIQHLLRAVGNNVFEIEVLELPDCCTESKLKDRIQNREYRLLEKWSMKCLYSKVQQPSLVDVPQLLRAVRSFLHFSQLSAWLSSSKGKSPSNIYYWVKSCSDGLSAKFDHEPEEHSFPVCKITEDEYGSVKVKYPPRTQYVPVIPCSKHPPLHGYPFKTISDGPSLQQNISLNSQVLRQLHKPPCGDQLAVMSETGCESEPSPELPAPTILKSFTENISDVNRVLKHSFCPDGLVDASNLSFELKQSKSLDLFSKSQNSYLYNYAETYSNGLSQENVCFDTSQLIRHLRKKRFKIRRINRDENSASLKSLIDGKSQQRHSVEHVLQLPTSNPHVNVAMTDTVLKCEASPVNETSHHRKSEQKKRPSKRKVLNTDSEKSTVIPLKKVCCDKYVSKGYQLSLNCLNEIFPLQNSQSSQVNCNTPVIPSSVNLETENGNLEIESCVGYKFQTLEPSVSNEADIQPIKCFSRSSTQTNVKTQRANQKSCKKRKRLMKSLPEEKNMDVDKNTYNGSENRACFATSVVDQNNKNMLKKVKFTDDCAKKFSFPESCNINETTHFEKHVYNPALDFKKSEEIYVCRKRILKRNSDLSKNQTSLSSNCEDFHIEIHSNRVHNFSSSLQTESKSNILHQRNELQSLKARLKSISKEKNRRLEAKLLKRYNKVFAAKCRENSSETTLIDFKQSSSECKSCNRTHRNSSKCGLEDKKLNSLTKKIRKLKMTLKGLKEESMIMKTSAPIDSKSSEISLFTAGNKSHRIKRKKRYKSSKELSNPTSSQMYTVKKSKETTCASDTYQCQESRPNSQLPKQISLESIVTATRFSPEASLAVSSKTNCNFPPTNKSEHILEPNEITQPIDRYCPFVLNRWVPSNIRSIT